jgi:hypothetical protein
MAFVCRCTKHLNPPGLASLFVQSRALPDERHITRHRSDSAIMDTDRGCARHLDVDGAGEGDGHDVGSRCATVSLSDGRGGPVVRFQADPLEAAGGNMQQTRLTYCLVTECSAAAHDQHRSAGGRRNRCAVRASRKVE